MIILNQLIQLPKRIRPDLCPDAMFDAKVKHIHHCTIRPNETPLDSHATKTKSLAETWNPSGGNEMTCTRPPFLTSSIP